MKKIYLILIVIVTAFSNTTNAQVTIVNDNNELSGYPILGTSIFLTSDVDSTLWKSDGTPGGTAQYAFNVKIDMDQGAGVLNNKIYFAGIDATHGSELWVTDGTAAGTTLVQDLVAGTKSSTPSDFFTFKGDLYFTDSSSFGRELYKMSGSNGTISLLKDINPGNAEAFADDDYINYYSNNNLMYFVANDGTHGKELWVSDGTSGNTKMLSDITPGSGNTNFLEFTRLGNLVIFTVSDANNSLDLWKTDGTNTTLIRSFGVNFSAFASFGLLPFNNKIYFGGTDAANGTELWSTDGNTASMMKDIYPGNNGSNPQLFNAVFINGRFLFTAMDDAGTELWSSDGTAANTTMIKDINPGEDGSDPILFPVFDYSSILEGGGSISTFDFYQRGTLFNGYIFFSADDGTSGTQLWKTDGTAAGTVLVQNIGGAANGIGDSYFYTKTGLYFSADDGTNGMEPWFTDGTTASMVADINPGSASSNPDFSFLFNNKIFGTANNGNGPSGSDLYRIDATVSVLPIQLLDFKTTLQSSAVQLSWKTATEINSKDFVIQRSADGVHFSDIGTVAAAGSSTSEKSYLYNDEQYLDASSNLLYYRLQLNDRDGKTSYSQIQTVKLNAPALMLKTYPNPVQDQLSVLFGTSSSKTAVLKISDLNGKVIYRKNFGTTLSARLQNINVSGFAKGTYLIQLITDKGNKVSKFVKQ